MFFSLDVLRARKGDCLMLHYGTKSKPRLLMIDGGPSKVYKPHLRPRIFQLRKARKLKKNKPLPVDVLMISHVDDDHCKGIQDLTKELRGLKRDKKPSFLKVNSFWHNSFANLVQATSDDLTAEAKFGTAALGGESPLGADVELDEAKVLASVAQGFALQVDAKFLKWKANRESDGKLIMATAKSKPISLPGGLKLTLIGPMKPELRKLQKAFAKFLRERKKKAEKSSEAALAAFTDKSIPNLSSLVMLAEAKGKKILLTGDARGDKILEGCQLVGLLGPDKKSKMHVDVFKVPHHGSANNLETTLFERITADHYVFSGDGEHGNPERESLEMLLKARGDADYTIHLTYPVDELDAERKKDWDKLRARELKRKKKAKATKKKSKKKTKVREAWSAKKHSLTGLFNANKKFAKKVRIVKEDQPHVIDLLDKLKV